MKIIACVDDTFGMLFNNRRQSRDAELIQKVMELCEGSRLWVGAFSQSLFDESVIIDDQLLEHAAEGDYCFVENQRLLPYAEQIEELILFKWNRRYPSDVTLDIDLAQWSLVSSTDFCGSSHEKITMEVYRK